MSSHKSLSSKSRLKSFTFCQMKLCRHNNFNEASTSVKLTNQTGWPPTKIKNAELRVEQLWSAGSRWWQMWQTYKQLPVSYPVTKEWFCPSSLFHQTQWETSPLGISVTKKQKICFCFVSFYTFAAFELSWCQRIFYFGVQRNSRGRCGSQDTSCRSASQRGRSISPSACKSAPTGDTTCYISFICLSFLNIRFLVQASLFRIQTLAQFFKNSVPKFEDLKQNLCL